MGNTTTTPAAQVGIYHNYNCGSIFGKWFDLTEFDSRVVYRPYLLFGFNIGSPNFYAGLSL